MIGLLVSLGTPGTPFQAKPSHAYARARGEKVYQPGCQTFSVGDVREASVPGPIPVMDGSDALAGTLSKSVILIQDRARTGSCQQQRTSRDAVATALERRGRCGTRRRMTRCSSVSLKTRVSHSAAGSRWLSLSKPASRSLTTSKTNSGRPSRSVPFERQNGSLTCHGRHKELNPRWSANQSRVLRVLGSQPPARG